MKKILINFIFLFCVLSVTYSSAQLINYERRNKAVSQPQEIKAVVVEAHPKKDYIEKKEAIKAKTIIQLNDAESIYDQDSNGKLDDNEKKNFFKSVILAIEEEGLFKVNSELLKEFDRNGDGEISRYEAYSLKKEWK